MYLRGKCPRTAEFPQLCRLAASLQEGASCLVRSRACTSVTDKIIPFTVLNEYVDVTLHLRDGCKSMLGEVSLESG